MKMKCNNKLKASCILSDINGHSETSSPFLFFLFALILGGGEMCERWEWSWQNVAIKVTGYFNESLF